MGPCWITDDRSEDSNDDLIPAKVAVPIIVVIPNGGVLADDSATGKAASKAKLKLIYLSCGNKGELINISPNLYHFAQRIFR